MLKFKSVKLQGWRQFRAIEIELHDRLTILTGANGAGKTTILNLLSRHFGWHGTLVSTLHKVKYHQEPFYFADFWEPGLAETLEQLIEQESQDEPIDITPEHAGQAQRNIGSILYSDSTSSDLLVPITVASTYQVQIEKQQNVLGLHIPSHRPLYSYQPVASIPTIPRRQREVIQQYLNLFRQRCFGHHSPQAPNYYIKETLIALATFGYGNEVVERDQESLDLFKQFESVLTAVLPPTLGFEKLLIRIPEVILVTRSGDFSIDAVSGGVASIIDIAWQLFMYSPDDRQFVVTIDEPENHLHPELQRTVLANLLAAFPETQFIVATHNPFIVGSVPDSNVYVLNYDDTNKVSSRLLDTANRAGSSNEILRDVLGLSFTMPLWVEKTLEEAVAEFEKKELTKESLADLRNKLAAAGLERFIPETVARIASRYIQP